MPNAIYLLLILAPKNHMRILLFVTLIFSFSQGMGQFSIDYYFPSANFNAAIPTPNSILGYEIGEKHISHDQLINYLKILDEASGRINMEEYGRTHEGRPLYLLTISSEENIKNVDKIREEHVALSQPDRSRQINMEALPSVIWMGFSVHGNEPSGTNASVLLVYYLAASESEVIAKYLNDVIILVDPAINPDGMSRFAQYVNQFHARTAVADPNNLEHNEPWPGGRTNHYWFDLNRDWLLLRHPESKGRMAKFHQWKPNIVTDHHEMGSNSTFFFQPGIPSRNNPNTPEGVFALTDRLGTYFAAGMDEIGSLYYARESFDDFYYGKGSTYPDINGGVGILFEQASSRGHIRETDNGLLTFPFTIRNQFTAAMSTLKAGYDMRLDLLEHQRDFYHNALSDADSDPVKGYVFDGGKDHGKTYEFIKILQDHQINVYHLNRNTLKSGYSYMVETSFIVPLRQNQYRLIKTLFEKETHFTDSLFYDVSAWTLPLAFDMNYDQITAKEFSNQIIGKPAENNEAPGRIIGASEYAYLMKWDDYNAGKALYQLFKKGLKIKVSEKTFQINEDRFEPGTILIPVAGQDKDKEKILKDLTEIALNSHVNFFSVETGYTSSGINLGSPSFTPIMKPEILLLVGDGISSYEAGEVWHLLDHRFEVPVSVVSVETFNNADLKRYNTIIMVNGSYNEITENGSKKLQQWISEGGKLIAMKGASKWLVNQKIAQIAFRNGSPDTTSTVSYSDLSRKFGAQVLGGAIFKANIDMTHPLCYGYRDDEVSIFINSQHFFEKSKNPFNNPVMLGEDPLQSGYINQQNYDLLKNSSAMVINSLGRGKIIHFSFDPNFRAFWYGTNRMFLNALFYGDIISSRSTR